MAVVWKRLPKNMYLMKLDTLYHIFLIPPFSLPRHSSYIWCQESTLYLKLNQGDRDTKTTILHPYILTSNETNLSSKHAYVY